MTDRTPDLSIIIVNWNTRALLRRCLDSVAAATGPLTVEVVVVDNGSRDGSQEMLRAEFPGVTLVENTRNLGFAQANNQGAACAHAPVLLLLNSDAAVFPDALVAVGAYIRAHPDVGAVGLQLLNDDLTLQVSGRRFPTLLSTIVGLSPLPERWRAAYDRRRNARDYAQAAEVDEVSGAAMAVQANVYHSLGGFDPRYYFFGEDIDLCWRIEREGRRVVYLPWARAIHSWGGSRRRGASVRPGLLSQRAQYQLLRRHAARWQGVVLWLYLLLFTAARGVRAAVRAAREGAPSAHVAAHLYMRECLWLLRHGTGGGR